MDVGSIPGPGYGSAWNAEAGARTEARNVLRAARTLAEAGLIEAGGVGNEMTFALDRETRRTVVRIVDRETKEVIRQIPSEEILRMAARYSQWRG
jgi:hypothetical protein